MIRDQCAFAISGFFVNLRAGAFLKLNVRSFVCILVIKITWEFFNAHHNMRVRAISGLKVMLWGGGIVVLGFELTTF